LSVTAQTTEPPPTGVYTPAPEDSIEHEEVRVTSAAIAPRPPAHERQEERSARLSEQPSPVLLRRISRLEASLGASLAMLRRCIVERETPTREALAAEAGFALGMSREAALAELDQIAQIVGVSSLR